MNRLNVFLPLCLHACFTHITGTQTHTVGLTYVSPREVVVAYDSDGAVQTRDNESKFVNEQRMEELRDRAAASVELNSAQVGPKCDVS